MTKSHTTVAVEAILERASSVAGSDAAALRAALDALPAAVYLTDVNGVVTYFNPACIDFAGRQPEIGRDRWCVSWKLFTDDGEPLAHGDCPMALAIRTRKPVRGVTAVAERPDGTRVTFQPHPTPIFAEDGALVGAVNILVDVTDAHESRALIAQAHEARRLALVSRDPQTAEALGRMAEKFEARLRALRDEPEDKKEPPHRTRAQGSEATR